MSYRILISVFLFCSVIVATGCATILTAAAPKETTYEEGRPFPGEASGAIYSLGQTDRRITVYKKATCPEMKEKTQLTRKRPRGMIIAVLEVPLFGLGVADMVAAGLYSKVSEERTFIENTATGKIIKCGDKEPAPDEDIIIDIPELNYHKTLTTNAEGQIDLSRELQGQNGDVFVKLCLKSDQTCRWNIIH